MKLKVAVIGCSHTDLYVPPRIKIPQGLHEVSDNDAFSWLWHISEANKDIDFDCYAMGGAGPVYFDHVLKYIIKNKIEYDACILQLTSESRWLLPFNHNKKITWTRSPQTDNLNECNTFFSGLWIHPNSFATGHIDHKFQKTIQRVGLPWLKMHCHGEPFSEDYNKSFGDTCEIVYGKFFKQFHYFTIQSGESHNNIDLDCDVYDYFMKNFDNRKFVNEWLTRDTHMNYHGSKIFAEKIVQPRVIDKIKKLKSS